MENAIDDSINNARTAHEFRYISLANVENLLTATAGKAEEYRKKDISRLRELQKLERVLFPRNRFPQPIVYVQF